MDPILLLIGFGLGIILIAMIVMWVIPFLKTKKEDEPIALDNEHYPRIDRVSKIKETSDAFRVAYQKSDELFKEKKDPANALDILEKINKNIQAAAGTAPIPKKKKQNRNRNNRKRNKANPF